MSIGHLRLLKDLSFLEVYSSDLKEMRMNMNYGVSVLGLLSSIASTIPNSNAPSAVHGLFSNAKHVYKALAYQS